MRLFLRILLGVVVIILLLGMVLHFRAKGQREGEEAQLSTLTKNITVSSRSFSAGGTMPVECTCKGREVSPGLTWEGNQAGTKAYVILTTDYDVPSPAFPVFNLIHWVIYNLPASVRSLPEAVSAEQVKLLGGKIGKNSAGDQKYIGPCPPFGRHAYVFRVYALDTPLSLADVPTKQDVLDAMQGHILGYGELKGYFQ
ncbi:YbhB/YbcL family Raf kinase inhibitor-like protein [Spirosoma taeanense]|uniref:YbhB/YbcL family Raf kinase inhibitor-like protein n=1 Tax=Spirosoma taeanense TaxID=2735870 RepID=A0A6M5Y606_9BACT|nr:YbhB/YbcL family Raf kinase inhibitor-like protein [Spirosoma taeanense]QJW88661.1 YbhB/YbcL family Raf kinase inhibitor-like protein [Spirosoma taeanense]